MKEKIHNKQIFFLILRKHKGIIRIELIIFLVLLPTPLAPHVIL